MFGPSIPLTYTDDRLTLGGADLTGKVTRVALEIDYEARAAWLSFQAAVDIGELGLTFEPEQVKGYLGGAGGKIDKSRADIVAEVEAATVQAMGFGSGEDAVGQAVYELLREWGVVE